MASPVSTIQMNLATQPAFLARVQYTMCVQAAVVLAETGVGVTHAARAAYAKAVLQGPAFYASVAVVTIVGGINVTGATTYDETAGVATCSVTDAALLSQVATFWNKFAGIDQGN